MNLSHKECERRYRMKKKLQLEATEILNSWQLEKMSKSSRTPREIKAALDKIVALPFNWTEKQYTDAKRELSLFKFNLYLESNAAAFCLATLPKSYVKPEWLASYMEKIVENNCKNIKIVHMIDEKPVG